MTTLDSLTTRQAQLGKEIEKLANTYYSDAAERKTLTYLEDKHSKLQTLWSEFEVNDKEIREKYAAYTHHQYFTSNYHTKVQLVYDKVLAEVLSLINTIQRHQATTAQSGNPKSSETATTHKSSTELQKLIRNQERLLSTLNTMLDNANAISEVQSPQYYQVKAQAIQRYWEEIEDANKAIWESVEDKTAYGYDMQRFLDTQEKYQAVLIKFADEQGQRVSHTSTNVPMDSAPMMRLPKIELPKFDGNYLKWQQFFDLFSQMVHSRPMSNVQKMFYLKANLEGEAERLIRHIPVSDGNYSSAWDVLINRYANKRLLVTALLDKLLTQPSISNETSTAIKNMHDITRECVLGLENLGLCVYEQWDPILLHILLKKLDKGTHAYYEQSLAKPRELQTLKKFLEFLELRFQALEALGQKKPLERASAKSAAVHTTAKPSKRLSCYYCNKDHTIYYCDQFLSLSAQEKQAAAKRLNLCLNCLRQGHKTVNCTMSGCRKCRQRHNTMLHYTVKDVQREDKPSSPVSSHVGSNTGNEGSSYVFLGTASAFVLDGQGQLIKCRVLLDSGSQVSLISERLSQKLKLPKTKDQLDISGIGNSKSKTSDRVHITLTSRENKFQTSLEVHVIKEITFYQPQQYVNIKDWNIPNNITLADPDFNKPNKIDILIGAELYGEVMLNGQVRLGEKLPMLQNTTLGWIVLGKFSSQRPFCGITNAELDNRMRQFWEMEDCSGEQILSQADKRCEDFFKSTTSRNEEGRYIVNLPIFTEPSLLGSSQEMAERRLLNLEKKLIKRPELYKQYKEFLKEYLRLGHMKEIKRDDIPKIHYYVPHQYVLKPTSSTTKLRVVFDASAKTSSNLSLNDLMVPGPRIQDELFDIVLRFRGHKYVFTADIAQMYRQILVHEEDRNLQLILWRDSPSSPMKIFQLLTLTYGTKPAQFLATRCLQQLSEDEAIRYPLGAEVIKDFYVDDIITGRDSLFEVRRIREELSKMMKAGGFKLRKWCANHPAILEDIPQEDLEMQIDFTNNNEDHVKTLGLSWEPRRDCFKYTITWPERTTVSKRTILADIAQLYDPLGLVNPVVVLGKIFMQQLWALELDWDDQLPEELEAKWLDYRANLRFLDDLKVGRYAIIAPSAQLVELHAFADASEKAFGVAVYVRSMDHEGNIQVKLLCAKSRVAPRKFVTLPRLELCAAKLATQLVQRIKNTMSMKFSNITYWSDSTIVLSWIHGDAATLKTFNANRVQRIQELSSPSQWKHISTKLNPADMVSRGATPQQLVVSEFWFCGPAFLKTPVSDWPKSSFEFTRIPSEEKAIKVVLNCAAVDNSVDFISRINHGNSFWKLQRVVAYVLRSIKIFKRKLPKENATDFLQVKELDEALMTIVRAIQVASFNSEIEDLKKGGSVKRSSRLATLAPFLDGNGLLRVGGRLEAAEISYGAKHPLILPGDHVLPKLLLNHLHIQNLHAAPQALMAIARQRFWILQARTLIRSIVNNCVLCARAKPRLMQQLMGNLPSSRVLPGRPFLTTGVDFCGPIWTHYKLRGKRPHKSYVAVFCCFATKAVHLEVVSDLSTEAFIGALKRFTARRGLCRDIYCDNATNFVGASNKLDEIANMMNSKEAKEKIADECSKRQIQFHFSPPRAPHFGGLWEAAVKSFKQLLYKTVAPASLTFEELTTVVAEIEAVLNSRPLTPMSSDPNDLAALTPGHFLIGEPLTAVPDAETTAKMSSLSRWKLVSSLTQEFWKRWTTEYLTELQKRVKWTKECPNIEVGAMVIIKDDNLPPLRWPLGRVTNIHQGKDGRIRVVEVRTASGTYTRAIHNLCPLPVSSEDNPDVLPSTNKRRNPKDKDDDSRKKRRSVPGVLGALLLTCLLLPCSSFAAPIDQYVQVQPFANQAGIYYENLGHARITSHDWKWVVYYNMSSYWNMLTTIEKGVKKLEILQRMITKQSYIEAIVKQHQHVLREIHQRDELLLSHHGLRTSSRSRRGLINGVGMVARKLFGVLDEEYATEVKETIKEVKNNEDHLLRLLKNQTSVIEATASIIKRSEEERIKQAKAVQNTFEIHLEQLKNMNMELKEQHVIQIFLSLSTFVSLITAEYQQIQDTLLDTIMDVHHGKMNTRVMSSEKLRSEINVIKEHLPPFLNIPSKEVSDLYRLMTVRCDVSKEYAIFVVRLPLATISEFELFKLIPLPSLVNGSYVSIKPSTDLLMVNLQKDAFYQLSLMDFSHCIELNVDYYLCPQMHPIYDRNADVIQCEAEMMNRRRISDKCPITIQAPSRIWIQLRQTNQWLFSLERDHIYNIVCGRHAFQTSLRATGLLTLQKGCTLKDDQITLVSHSQYDSKFNATFHPTINLTEEILLPRSFDVPAQAKINVLYGNHKEELLRLHERINDIRQEEFLPNILQPHDIHQFGIGYAALGMTVTIGIFLCYLYHRLRTTTWRPTRPFVRQQHRPQESLFTIELDKFKGGEDVSARAK